MLLQRVSAGSRNKKPRVFPAMSAGDSGLFKPTLEEKSGQLQGKPGRDTLHTIALDVAAIPHGEGNRDRHARLELHIVRIIGRQACA